MTRTEAENKAIETSKLNNRQFRVVQVTYSNGEQGWDVTPVTPKPHKSDYCYKCNAELLCSSNMCPRCSADNFGKRLAAPTGIR